jgi:hypothetical protein
VVYRPDPFVCVIGDDPDAAEDILATEEDRVKDADRAVDIRNGLDEAGTVGGIGDGFVGMGGREGGPTEVDLPPGVSARVRVIPILGSVSYDCDADVDRDDPAVGVELRG